MPWALLEGMLCEPPSTLSPEEIEQRLASGLSWDQCANRGAGAWVKLPRRTMNVVGPNTELKRYLEARGMIADKKCATVVHQDAALLSVHFLESAKEHTIAILVKGKKFIF